MNRDNKKQSPQRIQISENYNTPNLSLNSQSIADFSDQKNKNRSDSEIQSDQNSQQNVSESLKQKRQDDGITIFCQICKDFIAHSITTPCVHTFCELCLIQYMLYIDQCPICTSRLRHQRLSNNILLDNLIMDYIKKYEPEEMQIFLERIEKFKSYQKDKKINNFHAGMKVDVRDTDYVWCTGRIHKTVNKIQEKKMKWMIVKYDKINRKQEFPENSARIAPFGFYTGRKDIPKYHKGNLIFKSEQQNAFYTIPNHYQDEEQKEENEKQEKQEKQKQKKQDKQDKEYQDKKE